MKHFVLFAVLAFAFDAGPAHGATGPSFPLCLNTSVETQCPASVVPKSSCYYVRDDCKELWDKDGIGKKPLRRTKRLIQVKLGVYEYFHKQRSYPNPSLLFSGIECSESLDVVVKLSIPKANITSCVRFNFSSPDQTCSDIKELLYDCRWLRDQYNVVEVPWTIEYRAINGVCGEYAKYHFSLPKNGTADREVTGFNDFQLLIYREDEQCPPCEIFRWSKPPEKFEVTKYRVTLHYKENNVTRALSTTFVEDTIVSFCTLPEVGTNYYVSVAPCRECSGNNCICGAESFSNPFYTRIITTQGITVLGLVLSFLVLLLLILGWNLIRVYAGRKVAKYKKCILMFEPSSKSHVIILTKLVRFLEKSMNVRVLFGEKDIGNENSTDWYSTKLKEADLVLIVSNPTPNNLEDVAAASTYYPVYTSGCVKEFLRDIIHSEKKFIRILLPYCTDKHFYDFTTTKRCYSLKKDPRRLLQEIIGPSFWLPPIVGWAMFAPYFDTDEWADLLVALDKYPYLYSAAMGDDSDYEGSCRTSVSDEDEAIPMDVMPRVAMLQAREDEESSGSDSESPPHKSLEAVSLKSVDVAIDNLVDAQLFNNV